MCYILPDFKFHCKNESSTKFPNFRRSSQIYIHMHIYKDIFTYIYICIYIVPTILGNFVICIYIYITIHIPSFHIQGVLKLLVQTSHTNRKQVFKHFFFIEKTSKYA